MPARKLGTEERLKAAFDFLVSAAIEGRVCPKWHEPPMFFGVYKKLSNRGLIRVLNSHNYGHTFTRVVILVGEHAGAKTASDRGPRPSDAVGAVRHVKPSGSRRCAS